MQQTRGQALGAAATGRPQAETPWVALHRAFDGLVQQMLGDPRSLSMTRVMLQAPELGGAHAGKETSWRFALAQALVPRLRHQHPGANGDDLSLQAAALTAAGMACLTTAQTRWVDSDGTQPLPQLTMTALAPSGNTGVRLTPTRPRHSLRCRPLRRSPSSAPT